MISQVEFVQNFLEFQDFKRTQSPRDILGVPTFKSSEEVFGGNGHKYASHTTSLLASPPWNGSLIENEEEKKKQAKIKRLSFFP